MNPTDIYTAYINAGQHYAALTQPYALHLLALLITVEVITIGLTYMMGDSDNPGAVLWAIGRLLFTGGFAYWWLIQSWTLGIIVVGSFNQLGQKLTGAPDLTPMHFISLGLSIAKVIWASPSSARMIPNLGAVIGQLILCFAIIIIFLFIAALAVFTLTAFYLILGPASILVAFLPCRFTTSMAEGYFTWLVRTGVVLLFFYVVLGTAQTFAVQWNMALTDTCAPSLAILPLPALGITPLEVHATTCTNPIPTPTLLTLLADMVVLGVICLGIPFMAGAIVNHGVNMTLEHLASAKYLTNSLARPIVRGMTAAATHIRQAIRSNNSTTLERRIAAGAAAAAATRPSQQPTTQLPKPAPINAFGVQRTKGLNGGGRGPTTKL